MSLRVDAMTSLSPYTGSVPEPRCCSQRRSRASMSVGWKSRMRQVLIVVPPFVLPRARRARGGWLLVRRW
ncbi:hypothetical protein ACFPRL_29835 [Pseudoclavibacter helvolus]